MKNLKDIITIARQIAADESLAVEVTDQGVIRTTIENPRENFECHMHVGESPVPTTRTTRTMLVITRHDGEDIEWDAEEMLEDGDGLGLPGNLPDEDWQLRRETEIRDMIRGAVNEVHTNVVA